MNFTNSVRKIVILMKLIHGASVLVQYPKSFSINISAEYQHFLHCFGQHTVISLADMRA